MHSPVVVTPAEPSSVVSIGEAMRHCRIEIDADDADGLDQVTALLNGYVAAALTHLEGWESKLNICVAEQALRQEFDSFDQCLFLPLGPVISIESVTWRNSAGQMATVAAADYSLRTNSAGMSHCRFRNGYSRPSDLYEIGAVSVEYVAGYETVPAAIKQAILLMVGAWYENREETVVGVSVASLPNAVAVDRLISPYRKMVI